MSKFDTIEPSVFSMIRGGPEIAGKVSSRLLARCRSTRPLHPAVDSEDEEEEAPTGTTVVCCAYCGMSTGLSSFARLLIVHYVIQMQPRRRMHPRHLDASTVV